MENFQYQVGGSLPDDAQSYVTREADRELYQSIKDGQYSYVLNSRQMGKSSLRVQVMKQLQDEKIACASIDLTQLGEDGVTTQQWYYSLIQYLYSKFKFSNLINLRSWLRERSLFSPVACLNEFIETILLTQLEKKIVIFVDEIDSIISFDFPTDDFFAWVRSCYNQRVDNADYNRLVFVLLGSATPCDLIKDKSRTPFNIGKSIHLEGFKNSEIEPLTHGLKDKAANPHKILEEILNWTGGQPFLTQKLCKIIDVSGIKIESGEETQTVRKLVRSQIVENWENQDDPEHLKTIRDRLIRDKINSRRLLGLYQEILQKGKIAADRSIDQMRLQLSGLAIKKNEILQPYNRIYASIFDLSWVQKTLADLRPYSQAIRTWLDSGCQDESKLLRGKSLENALKWSDGKNLSNEDNQFLSASQQLDRRETKRKFNKVMQIVSCFVGMLISFALFTKLESYNKLGFSRRMISLEREGINNKKQFESGDGQIDSLVRSLKSGENLKKLAKKVNNLQDYPTTEPIYALQSILNNIYQRNQVNDVMDVLLSPDGTHIVTAGKDGVARLWNLDGHQIQEFVGHKGIINRLRFNSQGDRLVTASEDGTARLWDLSGQQLAIMKGHQGEIQGITFSHDNQFILTLGKDETVRIWDLSGQQLALIKEHQDVQWIAVNPQENIIATQGHDNTVYLWNFSGDRIAELKKHQGSFTNINFSPDGQYLATAGIDGIARIWDLSGNQMLELKTDKEPKQAMMNIGFSPDGKRIATVGLDRTARIWNLTGDLKSELVHNAGGILNFVLFNQDTTRLITADNGGIVNVWDISKNQKILLFRLTGHQNYIRRLSISPDQKYIATASGDGTGRIWDFSHKHSLTIEGSNPFFARSTSFSPDGRYMATVGVLGKVSVSQVQTANFMPLAEHQLDYKFTELENNKLQVQLESYGADDPRVSFSSDGKHLVTAGQEGEIKIWNVSGQDLKTWKGHKGSIYSAKFSPNGKLIVTVGEDKTARLWDLSGMQLVEFKEHEDNIYSAVFSPDGQLIVTAGKDKTARLWDLSGNSLAVLKGHQDTVKLAKFSPDGTLIATASNDRTVKVWDLSGNQLTELTGHRYEIKSLTFSPDGKLIATASSDRTARLWDLSGKQHAQLEGHQSKVNTVQFSPSGELLATNGDDLTTRIWTLDGHQISQWNWGLGLTPDWQYVITQKSGTIKLSKVSETLDELLERGCDWLQVYFTTHPEKLEHIKACKKV